MTQFDNDSIQVYMFKQFSDSKLSESNWLHNSWSCGHCQRNFQSEYHCSMFCLAATFKPILISLIIKNEINNIIKLGLLPPALIPRIRQGEMPLDTVLCLDTSGSMGWNNNEGINQLKAAALKFLDGVQETAIQADLKVIWNESKNLLSLIYLWSSSSAEKYS